MMHNQENKIQGFAELFTYISTNQEIKHEDVLRVSIKYGVDSMLLRSAIMMGDIKEAAYILNVDYDDLVDGIQTPKIIN